jgi:hypothetical protein
MADKDDIFAKLKVTKAELNNSLEWYKSEIQALNRSTYQVNTLMRDRPNRLVMNATPGSAYLFKYNPKYAESLKYYDVAPLIFFLNRHPDPTKAKTNFYGINIHYLNYNMRLNLLKKLYTIVSNTSFSATTRIKTSWELLKGLSNANGLGLENCIKQYRYDHMESRFLEIPPLNWPKVAMLPIEDFKKASKQKVWYDSSLSR